jgi:hypothetical protein
LPTFKCKSEARRSMAMRSKSSIFIQHFPPIASRMMTRKVTQPKMT